MSKIINYTKEETISSKKTNPVEVNCIYETQYS